MAILCLSGWHEALITVILVLIGFLYTFISTVPCLCRMFRSKYMLFPCCFLLR
jgi:hypothetical protein